MHPFPGAPCTISSISLTLCQNVHALCSALSATGLLGGFFFLNLIAMSILQCSVMTRKSHLFSCNLDVGDSICRIPMLDERGAWGDDKSDLQTQPAFSGKKRRCGVGGGGGGAGGGGA